MSTLFRWISGRQNGGYSKLTLALSTRFKFDAYIIRFPQGSCIPTHVDPVRPGFEHHRINITLKRPRFGGETFIAKKGYNAVQRNVTRRCYRFRPDIQPHSVTECIGGSLVLLSFGWLRKAM